MPAAAKAPSARPVVPLSAWYSGDVQADPPPFNLTIEAIDQGGKPLTAVKAEEPFKLRVTTDRDLHFVLLMVWSSGQVEVQPTNKNGFLKAGNPQFVNPDAKATFAISGILTGDTTACEYFVMLASTEPLPPLVVVKSRHSTRPACREEKGYPIYRFLFEPDAKFDPTRVVRKVVAVTVTNEK